MKRIGIFLIITLMGCATVELQPMAKIEGKVTIGPLCGNIQVGTIGTNPCGLSDKDLDTIYGAYSVILKNTGNAVVSQKKLDRTGTFSFEVAEGNYIVGMESTNSNAFQFTPNSEIQKSVSAVSSKAQYVEIFVNTGIK